MLLFFQQALLCVSVPPWQISGPLLFRNPHFSEIMSTIKMSSVLPSPKGASLCAR